jgi:YggT family protein
MGLFLYFLFASLISVVRCLEYVLIGYIIIGWLMFFGVIKSQSNILLKLYIFAMARIEPVLSLIRRFIPPLLGLDFSAVVVFFALHFAKILILRTAFLFM